MEEKSRFDVGVVATVGAALGATAVLGVSRVLDGLLDRNTTLLSRKILAAQPCGLPPFCDTNQELLSVMEDNALALDERAKRAFAQARQEHVDLTVDSGSLRLSGKLYVHQTDGHTTGERTWAVLAHPYRCSSHAMERVAALYLEHGFNVLSLDLRAHGESEGSTIGLGWKDGQDILEWVGYLVARFGLDVKIVLHGESLGAAACMNACSWNSYAQVSAVVCDSCFETFRNLALRVIRKHAVMPAEPLYTALRIGALAMRQIDLNRNRPIDAAAFSHVPALFINGAIDEMVPPFAAAKLYDACAAQNKRLHITPKAGHGASLLVDPQDYERLLFEFLAEQGLCAQPEEE